MHGVVLIEQHHTFGSVVLAHHDREITLTGREDVEYGCARNPHQSRVGGLLSLLLGGWGASAVAGSAALHLLLTGHREAGVEGHHDVLAFGGCHHDAVGPVGRLVHVVRGARDRRQRGSDRLLSILTGHQLAGSALATHRSSAPALLGVRGAVGRTVRVGAGDGDSACDGGPDGERSDTGSGHGSNLLHVRSSRLSCLRL